MGRLDEHCGQFHILAARMMQHLTSRRTQTWASKLGKPFEHVSKLDNEKPKGLLRKEWPQRKPATVNGHLSQHVTRESDAGASSRSEPVEKVRPGRVELRRKAASLLLAAIKQSSSSRSGQARARDEAEVLEQKLVSLEGARCLKDGAKVSALMKSKRLIAFVEVRSGECA